MGNPQETTETEKAWLAGMIEGDGAIGLGFQAVQKPPRKNFAVKPHVSFSNQDALLIEEVSRLFENITGKTSYIREIQGHFENSRSSMTVVVVGMLANKTVLEAILPYLKGEKQARARMIHRFLESRFSRHTGRGDGASRTPYNEEELLIIKYVYENGRRKGGKRNPDIAGILRDYTRAVAERPAKI